jgi:hypothetical protein
MIHIKVSLECDKCKHTGYGSIHMVGTQYNCNILNSARAAYRRQGWIATTKEIICPECKD